MVIKGTFSRKAPPPKIVLPKLYNKRIGQICALKRKPREQDAINLLYEIGNIVKDIMEEYGFNVKNLVEFSPKNDNLLGMNMNHGFKIFLRLRPSFDDNVFLPMNELVGTMLHELTHNKHGPHDDKFYKLLAELTSKQEVIMMKGGPIFQDDPFSGAGNAVGGGTHRDVREARLRRLDRKYTGGVLKVGGGSGGVSGGTLKEKVRDAALKRYEDNKWCNGSGELPNESELDVIVIEASDCDCDGDGESDDDDDVVVEVKKRKIEVIDLT